MSTTSSIVQQVTINNAGVTSNSVILQGSLLGVLLQHTSACDMKLQASFNNIIWWDVVTVTGTLGAPIASATDRKFLTVPYQLGLTGTLLRVTASVAVSAPTLCWIVTTND